MRIVYLSNYFNHHQKPLSDAFYAKTNGDYVFVETTEMPKERKRLGYKELVAPYVLSYLENKDLVDSLILSADVVILGEAPIRMVVKRLSKGLLTFHDNERRYKSPIKYLKWPIYTFKSLFLNQGHLLCASAFAARDFRLSGMPTSRCYKWGYFTEVKDFDIEELMMHKQAKVSDNQVPTILWAARFIQWKHPELVVLLAEKLRTVGYKFQINMIGTGPLVDVIKDMIAAQKLEGHINVLGPMSPEEVRSYMETSDIFLATSDQNEGWGATVNESMSSACAVVASHTIGAVPFLIDHKRNGLIFESKNIQSLCENVQSLLDNKEQRTNIAKEAYKTMKEVWHPMSACENFISMADALLKGHCNPISTGPCSSALVYENNWFLK